MIPDIVSQDLSQCTKTRFKTLENKHKPLVFKELRKIWRPQDVILPWKKGDYKESNTLLLDDSPYKALLNPVSSCSVFTNLYQMTNSKFSLSHLILALILCSFGVFV